MAKLGRDVTDKCVRHDPSVTFANLGECLSGHRIWQWERDGYVAVEEVSYDSKSYRYVMRWYADQPIRENGRPVWVMPEPLDRKPPKEPLPRLFANVAELYGLPDASVIVVHFEGTVRVKNFAEALAYLAEHELQVVKIDLADNVDKKEAEEYRLKPERHVPCPLTPAPAPIEICYHDPSEKPKVFFARSVTWVRRTYPGNPYVFTRKVTIKRITITPKMYARVEPKVVRATGMRGERHYASEEERIAEMRLIHENMKLKAEHKRLLEEVAKLKMEQWLREHLDKAKADIK